MINTNSKAYKFYISCFEKGIIPLNISYTYFLFMLEEMLKEVKK